MFSQISRINPNFQGKFTCNLTVHVCDLIINSPLKTCQILKKQK